MFIVLNVKNSSGFVERAYNVGKIVTVRHPDNYEYAEGVNAKVYYTDEDGDGCIASCKETFAEVMDMIRYR